MSYYTYIIIIINVISTTLLLTKSEIAPSCVRSVYHNCWNSYIHAYI